MSEIHEVNNSILSVFAAPARDISIDSYSFVEILEKSNTNQLSPTLPYYEIILNDRNSWLNLADAYLEVRGKLQTAAGASIYSGSVAPISDLQNIFRRAEMWIENKSVQTVEYPGVVSSVTDMIKISPDYDKSGSAELFYPDRGSGGINIIEGSLYAVNVTGGNVDTTLSGSGADPHVLTVAGGAENNVLRLFADGQEIFLRLATSDSNIAQLDQTAANSIDYAGIANGQILHMYDQFGKRVYLRGPTGVDITFLSANATPAIVFANGNATAIADNRIIAFTPTNQMLSQPGSTNNYAFNSRKSKFFDSTNHVYYTNESVFYIPIRKIFSFWDYNRHVWKGAIIRFRLDRDSNFEYIFRSNSITDTAFTRGNTNCQFVTTYMSLWLPIVKPNPLIEAKLNKAVAENASTLASWYDNEFYENNVISPNDNSEQIWKVTSKTERVVRVFMWVQKPTARTDQTVNKGVYGGFPIQSAQCSINGVIYPRTKYDLDPAKLFNYTRLYNEFLRAGGHVANPNTGTTLSIEEWFSLYEIVCFDLAYQPDSDKVYTGRISPSDIELRVKMSAAPGNTYRMYAIVQTERYAKAQAQSDMIKLL